MKKHTISALIIGLSLTFFCACGSGNASSETETDSAGMGVEHGNVGTENLPELTDADITAIRFGGIGLSTTKEELVKILGQPEKTETVEDQLNGTIVKYYYPSKGISIYLMDNAVSWLELIAPCSLKDGKNIGIGSSENDFNKAYNPSGTVAVSSSFTADIENGKVSKIYLSYRMD